MTRKTKISCDVTREADNMLKAYCQKHERSKGYLIEKMIRKFCGEVEAAPATQVAVVEKPKVKRKVFKAPTVDEVREYCDSRCNNVDPQTFVAHYATNGWMRGKAKIKDWKACVVTWENKDKPSIKVNESLGGKW